MPSSRITFQAQTVCFTCNLVLDHLLSDIDQCFTLFFRILNGNEISSIGENAFENLSNLQDIELNNNHLTTLPGGVFKSMGKLRKL